MYYSISTLFGLCLNFLPLTPSTSGQKMYLTLVISIIVTVQLGKRLFLNISFYLRSNVWQTIPCSSWDSLALSKYFFVYPTNYFHTICTIITDVFGLLRLSYDITFTYRSCAWTWLCLPMMYVPSIFPLYHKWCNIQISQSLGWKEYLQSHWNWSTCSKFHVFLFS